MDNSLLIRLSAQDAAKLIMLEPVGPVERHMFWRKREMRVKHSKANKPRLDDLKRLSKAAQDAYWEAFHDDWDEQFMAFFPNGKQGKPSNPLLFEQQGWKHGLYSQQDLEEDLAYFEEARIYLWLRFLKGQLGEGPKVDGLVYLKLDSLLQAEQLRCKNKRIVTKQLIATKRAAKRRAAPRYERWLNVGNDEAKALAFRQKGYTVRKIDRLTDRHWEVLMEAV